MGVRLCSVGLSGQDPLVSVLLCLCVYVSDPMSVFCLFCVFPMLWPLTDLSLDILPTSGLLITGRTGKQLNTCSIFIPSM